MTFEIQMFEGSDYMGTYPDPFSTRSAAERAIKEMRAECPEFRYEIVEQNAKV